MIVPNQYFDVTVYSTAVRHYRNLGYDVKLGDTITVPLKDLNNSNESRIKLQCDECGKIYETSYKSFFKHGLDKSKHYCKQCLLQVAVKEKYGVSSALAIPSVQEKAQQTRMEKYGAYMPSDQPERTKQTKTLKYGEDYGKVLSDKAAETNLKKYGHKYPMQVASIRDKSRQTVNEKYGVSNILQAESIKQKKQLTCMEKYGVKTPLENPEFLQKALESTSKHGEIKTSTQQIEIYKLISSLYPSCSVFINKTFRGFCFDIALVSTLFNFKIDIEYDGWYWHQDEQRDRRRDEISKSYGWKVLRIKGSHKLPTEEQLIKAIDKLVGGYSYTQIILDDWKEVKKA